MRHNRKDSGVSIVSVLVAIALLGLLAALISTLFSQSFLILKKQQDANTVDELRRYVRIGMACPPPGLEWVTGSEIAVPKRGGTNQTLIQLGSPGYTKIGSHCLRAVVTSVTPIKEFDVEYSSDCSQWKSLLYLKILCP